MPKLTPQQALGAVIQAERKKLGVSQEAFADLVGMHRTQLGAIEQGRKDCRLTTLLRLADALDLELWKLVKDAGFKRQ